MFKDARNRAGLSKDEAAFRIPIAPRTLGYYEVGQHNPPPDVVVAMANVYDAPELPRIYCKQYCPIGQRLNYEYLNGVSMDYFNVLLKLRSEMQEATEALDLIMDLIVNKTSREDFTPEEWLGFVRNLQEFLDVSHCIEIFMISLENESICNITEQVKLHNEKCWQRGYAKKGKMIV